MNPRRLKAIGMIFGLLAFLTILRLGYLQIIRHNYYSQLATSEHFSKYEIPAKRGRIFLQDRGEIVPVALNRNLKTLYADTRYIANREEAIRRLKEVLGGNAADKLNTDQPYVVLAKGVPLDLANKIEDLELSGIGLTDNYVRVYPENSLASQTLGFVNADDVGQYGVEEFLNKTLKGSPGLLNAKTDTRGIPIVTSDNIQLKPVNGSDIVLTIDRNIQAHVEKTIARHGQKTRARSVSALVMDPNTGAVLAMANYPTYDPNNYSKVTDYSVFSNQAATGMFEPGSGFKIFTMASGLNSGAVTPNETYYDPGFAKIGPDIIKNAADDGVRSRSMTNVITRSVNTGVIYVLKKLGGGSINARGKNTLYDYFTNHFYLHKKTGIEQAGEPDFYVAKPGEVSDVGYANMTFGQGITTTMVRMLSSVAAVINGGTLYKPYLVDATIAPDGRVSENQPSVVADNVVTDATTRQIKLMMETVIEEGGGFAVKRAGYRMGGKTGTAQIPNPAGGYFNNRDIGTFTGFAPLNKPKFIMMVRIDEPQVGGYAGSFAAGPIFGDIMEWLLKYSGTAPSGAP